MVFSTGFTVQDLPIYCAYVSVYALCLQVLDYSEGRTLDELIKYVERKVSGESDDDGEESDDDEEAPEAAKDRDEL